MDVPDYLALAGIILSSLALGVTAASETALERANDVRIRALASRGDDRARSIADLIENPQRLFDPLTLSRAMFAALIVACAAYIGARAFAPLPGALVIGLCGGLWTALVQMTVNLVVARQPEVAALRLHDVVRLAHTVFWLPAFILGLPARFGARSLRRVAPDPGTDILALVEREEAEGGVEEQERRMIRGIIALEDKTAREIMVPRIDMGVADVNSSILDVAALVNERGFSRVPVYRENIDDITGIVYAKDLLRAVSNGGRDRKLSELVRTPVFIPESKRLDDLLAEMQTTHTHMAIVVDEYGGTAGLVTIEDLLEEIVGEIEDEYDVARPTFEIVSEDEVVLDAGVSTNILDDLFSVKVDSEDFDTVGGLVIHELGRLPSVGDEASVDGLKLRVISMSGRRLRRLRVVRDTAPQPVASAS